MLIAVKLRVETNHLLVSKTLHFPGIAWWLPEDIAFILAFLVPPDALSGVSSSAATVAWRTIFLAPEACVATHLMVVSLAVAKILTLHRVPGVWPAPVARPVAVRPLIATWQVFYSGACVARVALWSCAVLEQSKVN